MFNMQSWSDKFVSNAKTPMSHELSKIFMQMAFSEGDDNFSIEDIKKEFLYQIIDKRAEFIGLTLSEPAKIFLMFMTKSPGTAVMYLYALRQSFKNVGMNEITNLFPMGYLSEESLGNMWDSQKGQACGESFDNCLDNYKFN